MRKRFVAPAGVGWMALLALMLMPLSLRGGDVNKAIVAAGKKATVLVEIYDGKTLKGWATAFCIDKSGVFVTNDHVAKSGTKG
jgi:S1-C subfamily serine protease